MRVAFAWVVALVAGCAPATLGANGACQFASDCPADRLCSGGVCVPRSSTDAAPSDAARPDGVVAVRDGASMDGAAVSRPALRAVAMPTSATLRSVDGSRPDQVITAMIEYESGTRPAVRPLFTAPPSPVGRVDAATGRFVASGTVGGVVTVDVAVYDPVAMTWLHTPVTITVNVEQEHRDPSLSTDVATRFSTVMPPSAASANVVYPLDNVVFPENVYPADIQWMQGTTSDVFRIRLIKPHSTATAYVAYDRTKHWLPPDAMWRSFARSDPAETGRIEVDRYVAASGVAVASAPIRARFIPFSLNGSIYYWEIRIEPETGRIVRIDDGTATRVSFMPNPPLGCIGCHAVSPSGRYMAGRFGGGDNVASTFDLTVDLTPSPAPTLFPTATDNRWWSSAWSPAENRLLVVRNDDNNSQRRMELIDPFTGAGVTTTGALPRGGTTPAWAPDNRSVAFASDTDAWAGQATAGDISTFAVLGPDTFGPAVRIHAGDALESAAPMGITPSSWDCDAYPTWTPDSRRLAFAHGTGARSDSHQSELYAMEPSGANVIRLTRALSETGPEDFQPRYSPFHGGGYYWLSFLSRRDYGNDTHGNRGARRQQIWVTAIRDSAGPGDDPSEVPYWIPGQDPAIRNIAAFWAPRACRPLGQMCSTPGQCCSGVCEAIAGGDPMCSDGPSMMDECHMVNQSCEVNEDCCESLVCYERSCQTMPMQPMCRMLGEGCGGTEDCCVGLFCYDSTCQSPIS